MIIIHINIRGLKANLDELKALINFYDADIIAINEQLVKAGEEMRERIQGFVCCECADIEGKVKVLLYVKASISFEVTKRYGGQSTASYIQIRLKYRRKFLRITAMYNPPGNWLSVGLLEELCTEQSIVIGDLNAKSVDLGC